MTFASGTRHGGWLTGIVMVVVLLTIGTPSRAEEPPDTWIAQLSSKNAGKRKEAAAELREDGGPPMEAVSALLEAAKVELDHRALREMLITLGHAGVLEALGLIQTYARSPARDLRSAGRKALHRWLVVNRVLHEDDELPEPPHVIYDAAPSLPADRPGGRSLAAWRAGALLEPSPEAFPAPGDVPPSPTAESFPAPGYVPPSPTGIMPGYDVVESPRYVLVGTGAGLFAGLYVVMAGINGSLGPDLSDDRAYIPIVGPVFTVVKAARSSEAGHARGLERGLLIGGGVVGTLGQAAGVAMIIAGLTTTKHNLVRVGEHSRVAISPTGVALLGEF